MAIKIQIRRDTAENWQQHNPILAEGEIACEIDTGYLKVGNGRDKWTDLTYANRELQTGSLIDLSAQQVVAPPSEGVRLYAKDNIRGMMAVKDGKGTETILAGHNGLGNIQQLLANGSNSYTVVGTNATGSAPGGARAGLVNHIFPSSLVYSTNGQAGSVATFGSAPLNIYRARGTEQGGYHVIIRFALHDTSYDGTGATTGSRLILGVVAGDFSLADTYAGQAGAYVGFKRVHNFGTTEDTNFVFISSSVSGAQETDTGLEFKPGCVYTAEFYAPRGEDKVYWQITNDTTGDSRNGSTNDALPPLYTMSRMQMRLQNINAQSRSMGIISMYAESNV